MRFGWGEMIGTAYNLYINIEFAVRTPMDKASRQYKGMVYCNQIEVVVRMLRRVAGENSTPAQNIYKCI